MKHLRMCVFVLTLSSLLLPNFVMAATQRVAIRITGRYCMFHAVDLEKALMHVAGVIDVDFESMRENVVVVMNAGKVNPDHLLAAVRGVRGKGYYCKGEFNGEPGIVEY